MKDLVIVSGTVFNEILLWCVDLEQNSPSSVRVTFIGHKVKYSQVGPLKCPCNRLSIDLIPSFFICMTLLVL